MSLASQYSFSFPDVGLECFKLHPGKKRKKNCNSQQWNIFSPFYFAAVQEIMCTYTAAAQVINLSDCFSMRPYSVNFSLQDTSNGIK